jgi:hypothetical protein
VARQACGQTAGPTSGDAQYTHDSDDGGVDGQRGIDLDLLQRDAHDGQQHYGQVQLVPPGKPRTQLPEWGKGIVGGLLLWHRKTVPEGGPRLTGPASHPEQKEHGLSKVMQPAGGTGRARL